MSKELEVLHKLRDLVENLTRIDYVPTDLRNEVKELLINSYEDSNGYFSQIEKALKRNKPIKVINGRTINGVCLDYYCPSCKQEIDNSEYSKDQHYLIKYCISCGQALDWGDKKWVNQFMKKR